PTSTPMTRKPNRNSSRSMKPTKYCLTQTTVKSTTNTVKTGSMGKPTNRRNASSNRNANTSSRILEATEDFPVRTLETVVSLISSNRCLEVEALEVADARQPSEVRM